jgi:hypothetical protein
MPGKEYHQKFTIRNWKKYGVISHDFNKLYHHHMSINNCQLCNILFNDNIRIQNRYLDHDHKTDVYRQTICHRCNIKSDSLKLGYGNYKSGHMWVTVYIRRSNKHLGLGFRY